MKYKELSVKEAIEMKTADPDAKIFGSILTPIDHMTVSDLINLSDAGVIITPCESEQGMSFAEMLGEDTKAPFPAIEVEVAPAQQAADDHTVELPEQESPPSPGKRKIDVGKIKALRKAGWSARDIAIDVGCSEATVYNHLKKMEEKSNE